MVAFNGIKYTTWEGASVEVCGTKYTDNGFVMMVMIEDPNSIFPEGVMIDFPMNFVYDWKNLSEREVHRIVGY